MSTTAPLQTQVAKPQPLSSPTHTGLLLQRKCACGAPTASLTGECSECRSKKRLQTKLTIGASNDPLEQEADRVADQVMAAPANPAVSGAIPHIQRFTGHAREGTGAAAPASVDRVLAGSGRPLEPALQQDMEQRFGHDFSRVQVHSGGAPEQSAQDVNAHAYTAGHNIVFGPGRFAPGTQEGRRLIAHELTHVVQQSGADGSRVDQSDDNRSLSPNSPSPNSPHSVDKVIASSGNPLPHDLQVEMERRFGADFSKVRIHSDEAAERSARDVAANAYTVGKHVVFARGQFQPGSQRGLRLIAHELTHVLQQSRAGEIEVLQRDAKNQVPDTWDNLNLNAREITKWMWDVCLHAISDIGYAQDAGYSSERAEWINKLSATHQARINAIDNDNKVEPTKKELDKYLAQIAASVEKSHAEWEALEQKYLSEYEFLTTRKSSDGEAAAKLLKNYYTEIKTRLDHGALNYVTREDYLVLKETLEKGRHLTVGILRSSRARVKRLSEMLDVVADIRREGEDAEKFVPGWETRIQEELAHLARLASETSATQAFDYPREFKEIRQDLDRRYRDTLKAHKPEKSVLEKGVDLVSGVVDTVVSPFIEAAKQLVDLVQICMHFATLGQYEARFTSDMAAAAKQGASTSDLLKGMVTGLIETPERLYKAIRDGDWEAIGREAANLYMLARSIKEVPDIVKKAPAMVARATKALRLLKARKIAIELHEARILPQKQATLTPPKVSPATETPLYLKESPPTQGFRGENQKPATARVDDTSKPVQGVRGENQKPATARVDDTSKPVQGFRGESQKPATARVDDTSKPVQGFRGENQKPATARTDVPDTVPTNMPRAREIPSRDSTNQGVTAQKRDQGATASANKDAQQSGVTADDRMARMDKARQEKLARDARAKELRDKPENQAKKQEPKEKSKEETKAEKKAQRLAQIESLQKQLAANRERQLQIYTEIERANQSLKRPMSDKARNALDTRKSELAKEANKNLEARRDLETSIATLEITPYDRARAYSYSDSAGQSVAKRAAGLDEMSGKPIHEPSIDHIVPVDDIVNTRGYDRLFPNEQRALLSNQRNLVLMEKGANSSKGSKSWAKWDEGRKIYGSEVADRMITLESNLRKELQGAIIQTLSERGVRI